MDLISVDSKNIRQHWMGQKQKALSDIQVIRSRLSEFEKSGRELYQGWLHRTFPGLLTRIRTTREKGAELESFLYAIDFEARWGKKKKYEAYQIVLQRKTEGRPLISEEARSAEQKAMDEEREAFADIQEKIRNGTADEDELEDLRESFRGFLFTEIGPDALFISDAELDEMIQAQTGGGSDASSEDDGDSESPFSDERFGYGRSSASDRASNSEESLDPSAVDRRKSLKTIYRELARRLHPDANGEKLTDEDRRLWHEVQAAYERGDVERLSALRAFVADDARDGNLASDADESISALIALVRGLKATLKDLRSSERRLQRDPVFAFFKKRGSEKKLQKFTQEMKHELLSEDEDALSRLQDLERILKRYAKVPIKKQPRAPKKNKPVYGSSRPRGPMTKAEMEEYLGTR